MIADEEIDDRRMIVVKIGGWQWEWEWERHDRRMIVVDVVDDNENEKDNQWSPMWQEDDNSWHGWWQWEWEWQSMIADVTGGW